MACTVTLRNKSHGALEIAARHATINILVIKQGQESWQGDKQEHIIISQASSQA